MNDEKDQGEERNVMIAHAIVNCARSEALPSS